MRSQYMRTAFQIQHDASVRISLDTNLCMIYERDTAVMVGERWYRDPTKAVPEDQVWGCRFRWVRVWGCRFRWVRVPCQCLSALVHGEGCVPFALTFVFVEVF